jgi:hypothetical protein
VLQLLKKEQIPFRRSWSWSARFLKAPILSPRPGGASPASRAAWSSPALALSAI